MAAYAVDKSCQSAIGSRSQLCQVYAEATCADGQSNLLAPVLLLALTWSMRRKFVGVILTMRLSSLLPSSW